MGKIDSEQRKTPKKNVQVWVLEAGWLCRQGGQGRRRGQGKTGPPSTTLAPLRSATETTKKEQPKRWEGVCHSPAIPAAPEMEAGG